MRNKQYISPSVRVEKMALANMLLAGSETGTATDTETLSFSPHTGKQW